MPRRLSNADAEPRTIAIGDIHGCATALRTMLAGLEIRPVDTVIMLGDAIDRGPDSRSVVAQLLDLRERCNLACILGNHEQMLLNVLDGEMPLQDWLGHGGAAALDSYGQGCSTNCLDQQHVDFIRGWIDCHETAGHFFCHGNYVASRPLSRQPWTDLRWQSLSWYTPEMHCSGKTAVVGHTSQKDGEILNLGYLVCIDTYCCGGERLTAFDVVTGQVWHSTEAGAFYRGDLPHVRTKRATA